MIVAVNAIYTSKEVTGDEDFYSRILKVGSWVRQLSEI